MKIKDILRQKLSEKELSVVPGSFDIVGDIMIFASFPEILVKKEKLVGNAYLQLLKNVRVVCRKSKEYSGEFRTPKLRIIAGEKRLETVHKENNCVFRLNVEACYFSPRLGTERKRIASLCNLGESILVLFSGVAPYPIVIARNALPKLIYGVEKNPKAHKYAQENVLLNKVKNIILVRGDAKNVVPKMKVMFDRVLMPLPKSAKDFLECAIPRVKKNGVLHFYDFLEEGTFKSAEDKVKCACRALGRKCRILSVVRCGQYSPRKFRVCVDAKII
jgi:tRNA (guanine37-N1)-methyltransferase